MKTGFMIVVVWLFALIGSNTIYAQEKRIDVKQLPLKAKDFLKTHYEKINVTSVKEEVESWFGKKEYSVELQDGKEIEFDQNGDWKEVDGNREAIPLKLIPKNILDYIQRSFPKNDIVKLKKERRGYEVAISNGLDLEFNREGKFIKIDD